MELKQFGVTDLSLSEKREISGGIALGLAILIGVFLVGVAFGIADAIENRRAAAQ